MRIADRQRFTATRPPAAPDWREQRRQRIERQQGGRAEPRESAPATPKSGATWALALALLAFGSIAWVLGGMFTLDGWVSWLNGFLGIVRLPIALPSAIGLWRLLFIPIAVIYSYVETKNRPVRRGKDGRLHVEAPLFWVGFILITLTDIGSTAVGMQQLNPSAWGVLQPTVTWIASAGWRIGAAATVLTFAPEWAILGGIWLLKR